MRLVMVNTSRDYTDVDSLTGHSLRNIHPDLTIAIPQSAANSRFLSDGYWHPTEATTPRAIVSRRVAQCSTGIRKLSPYGSSASDHCGRGPLTLLQLVSAQMPWLRTIRHQAGVPALGSGNAIEDVQPKRKSKSSPPVKWMGLEGDANQSSAVVRPGNNYPYLRRIDLKNEVVDAFRNGISDSYVNKQ